MQAVGFYERFLDNFRDEIPRIEQSYYIDSFRVFLYNGRSKLSRQEFAGLFYDEKTILELLVDVIDTMDANFGNNEEGGIGMPHEEYEEHLDWAEGMAARMAKTGRRVLSPKKVYDAWKSYIDDPVSYGIR